MLLVLGAVNYLFVSFLNKNMFAMITQNTTFIRGISLLIGLCGLYYLFNRDYYLPFLGPAVIPTPTFGEKEKLSGNLTSVKLYNLPPNTNVIFWAAKSSEMTIETSLEAYSGNSANSGIVKTNDKGEAIISINCPAPYKITQLGFVKSTLKSHVHYRYEIPEYKGIYSRVMTKFIDKC